jgi:hypothetical protein
LDGQFVPVDLSDGPFPAGSVQQRFRGLDAQITGVTVEEGHTLELWIVATPVNNAARLLGMFENRA